MLNETITKVTAAIVTRSETTRTRYLDRMKAARDEGPRRAHLTCGNLAHAFAASPDGDKETLVKTSAGNIGITRSGKYTELPRR